MFKSEIERLEREILEDTIAQVAMVLEVLPEEICSKKRTREIADARSILIWCLRKMEVPYRPICKRLKISPNGILLSQQKVKSLIESADPEFTAKFEKVTSFLTSLKINKQ